MTNDELRRLVFEEFSGNLSKIINHEGLVVVSDQQDNVKRLIDQAYACPICYELFDDTSLDQSRSNPLTIEHVPPKSSKGRPAILTCKSCNNRGGHELDHLLKSSLDVLTFTEGNPLAHIDTKVAFENDKAFKTKGSFDKSLNQFRFTYGSRNRHARRQLERIKGKRDPKFKLTFQKANNRRFNIALLRIAHLMAFREFGYAYLFSDGAKKAREQIMDPKSDTFRTLVSSGDMWTAYDGIYKIGEPREFNSYISVFRLNYSNVERIFSVVLHGPHQDDIDYYQSQIGLDKIKVVFGELPSGDYLNTSYLAYYEFLT